MGSLVNERVTGGFKDSFHDVEPVATGYSVLFSADWIWREAKSAGRTELTWKKVTTDAELFMWEAEWASSDPDAINHPRQFPSSLLDWADMEFWSAVQGSEIVGGVLLNATPPVVGVSNLFSKSEYGTAVWNDIPELAAKEHPGLEIVGYERDDDLEMAKNAGFESIGRLRIWTN